MAAPNELDLTVIVTTHGEGRLLRPTLRSIELALLRFHNTERTAELLLVCDRIDARTQHEVNYWITERRDLSFDVRAIVVDLGESGAARNAGASAASGRFIAFIDGDDLISDDYLLGAVERLEASDVPTVMHPHLVVSFGARSLLWETESTLAGTLNYRDLLRHNQWPSSSVMLRALSLKYPYRILHPDEGYGPEDWIWNIDTVAAGVAHDVVPDSMFFYRVRESGGVNNRHAESILPAFDLAGLRRHLPLPPEPRGDHLQETHTRRKHSLVHSTYARLLPVARTSTAWLSYEVKHGIYRAARRTYRSIARIPTEDGAEALSAQTQRALLVASEIEPAISWTAFRFERLELWHARDDGYGKVLDEAIAALGPDVKALVTVPWVGVGGADIVSLNYARAIHRSTPYAGKTRILATFLAERTKPELIPTDIGFVQLDPSWLGLEPHLQRRLIAQLFVLARPEIVVSVNSFHVTNALQAFHRQMRERTRIYTTLFAFDRIGAGYPVNPITDDAQRGFLDDIAGTITDNTATARIIGDILALDPERVLVHRQPVMDETPSLNESTHAFTDVDFVDTKPFRLLWPHRLDEEKSPATLVALSKALRDNGIPAQIDVWGQQVLSSDGETLMTDLEDAGVVYRGPYAGGLATLPTDQYHALLLTSKSEGLPLVLVQSMLLGLPVIASDVGGVSDIVEDGKTGLLTAGPDDIDGFVRSICSLMRTAPLRRDLIRQGHQRAAELHGWPSFQLAVERSIAF